MKRALALLVLLAAAVSLTLWGQSNTSATGYVSPEEKLPLPPPEQPIPYSHKLHVGTLGLKCADCHQPDKDGFLMTYPAEEKCMVCHAAIKTESPHIQKLAEFAKTGKSVPWVQIYRVPDYVWFAHDSHSAEADLTCEMCHGPVAEREQLFKEKPTNMIACMDCHAEHEAPNGCDVCHNPG